MKILSRICLFLWVHERIPLGPFAPYVLGGVIDRWPHQVKKTKDDKYPTYQGRGKEEKNA